MRISDWSSDVCSSDLQAGLGLPGIQDAEFSGTEQQQVVAAVTVEVGDMCRLIREAADFDFPPGTIDIIFLPQNAELFDPLEIGRASSRARVCQYVYISVGAVYLQTKII